MARAPSACFLCSLLGKLRDRHAAHDLLLRRILQRSWDARPLASPAMGHWGTCPPPFDFQLVILGITRFTDSDESCARFFCPVERFLAIGSADCHWIVALLCSRYRWERVVYWTPRLATPMTSTLQVISELRKQILNVLVKRIIVPKIVKIGLNLLKLFTEYCRFFFQKRCITFFQKPSNKLTISKNQLRLPDIRFHNP